MQNEPYSMRNNLTLLLWAQHTTKLSYMTQRSWLFVISAIENSLVKKRHFSLVKIFSYKNKVAKEI